MENIKTLAAIDRPREKLILHGPAALSDTELLAILLGSGSSTQPVHKLAAHLLGHLGHLSALTTWSADQLCTIKGIGPAKAAILLTAAELSMRQNRQGALIRITTDEEAINLVRPILEKANHLQYMLILLNQKRELLATAELQNESGLPQIMRLVTESGAYGFGLVRNTAPDENAQKIAEQQSISDLSAAAKMLGVRFFGLVIIPP